MYHNYIRGGDLYGKLKEATTLTTNDSITIVQDDSLTKWDEKRNIKDLMGDTLKLWNELDVAEKNFNFSSANDNYKLGAKVDVADVGVTKGETVAINGVSAANDETTKATIDFNNKAGFVLNDETALAINNAKLTAAQNDAVITINHSDATVTLNNAYVDGNIDGSQNFALTIDGSRTTTLNGTATNANTELKAGTLTFNTDTFAASSDTLSTSGGTVALNNNTIETYDIYQLDSNADAKYNLDLNLNQKSTDVIQLTDSTSTGTITIDSFNILGGVLDPNIVNKDYKIQILKAPSDDIQLALSDAALAQLPGEFLIEQEVHHSTDTIAADTNWNQDYWNYAQTTNTYGVFGLTSTQTSNDSIGIITSRTANLDVTPDGLKGDTLKLWNELDAAEKNFNFSSANDNYKLGAKVDVADVGVTKGETVAINGVSAANDETTKATIDFNNKAGFVLNDETALAINNAKLTAAQNDAVITINHSDATVTLNNAYVDGNIDGSQNFALTIDGSRTTTLNGTATNANTELKAGTLTFNTDTFAASSDTLSTSGGTVALNNNTIETYDIYQLDSNQTTYTLDLDLNNRSADMLHITEGTGSVTLGKFNLIGNILDPDIIDQTYKIKILNVESGDIQLTLDDQSSSQLDGEYFLGKTTTTSEDSIASNTPWDKTYWNYKQDTLTYGQLGLATTKTTNDSIGINISKQIITDKIKTDPMGDTLHLVNISDENTDKSFDFDDADNKYIQQENLGETSGNITINGKKEQETTSSIDMNGHSGFEITDNNNKITITNTSIENAQAQQGSVINVTATEATISLTNTNLLNNKATGEHGAAIYSNSNVELTADNYDITIKDNNTARTNEAIFMDNNSTLTLNAQNNGSITINDKINGTAGFSVKLDGDKSGEITLTDKIDNAQINMSDITLNLSGNEHFANSNFNALSGTINLINDKAETQIAKAMGIKGEIIVNVDADLKTLTMDRLANNTTITKDGFIHVDRINLLSDSTSPEIAIPFATPLIKDQTDYIGNNTVSKNTQVTQAFAPIYQYDVYYDNRKDMGYFVFKNTKKFNPSVLASSVASQAGSFTAISKTLDYSFEHADYYMNRSNNSKQLIRSTDHNNNRTPFVNKLRQEAIWAQPYGGKEDINLDNGPKVEVKSHGILAGADSNVKDISTNWSTATTFYAGYNGTHQRYNGIKIQQGGGVAGLTQSFYNHNFFTALTATAGFNRNKVKTMYGNEYFNSYVTGMASKTGYNLEFMHGKYIIQPTMQLAYSYIHTSKYKNKADVNISSDNLETIQIHPEIKFIANLPEFQPYASIGYVYNITDSTDFKANRIELPEMSVKPYMEYGLGFQKTWEKDLYGFMETTIKTGGREGIDFTIGIRGSL